MGGIIAWIDELRPTVLLWDGMAKEWKSRTVRLDDEVWEALGKHQLSANKLLRRALYLDLPDAALAVFDAAQAEVSRQQARENESGTKRRRPLREKGDGK